MKQWKQTLLSGKPGRAEKVILLIYPVLLAVLTGFHEFSFDELQAWQIARSASVPEILFSVEHYEGHPPLWHLLLAVFARAGVSFRIALPLVNIAFCTAAMAVLLFRSPFPKIIRCALPFSYYLFYQYGVLCRPYSMLMLAMLLAASNYHQRNAHPWKYILSLCLLCLSSAFGMLIAGIFCLFWTVEIIRELIQNGTFSAFFHSARFFSLLLILLLAIGLLALIRPAEDCYYDGMLTGAPLLQRFTMPEYWLSWLALPFDIWFGQQIGLDKNIVTSQGIIIEAFLGLVLLAAVGLILHHNRMLLFGMLPYLFISFFMVFYYYSVHHLGILALLHVFTAWILLEKQPEIPPLLRKCGKLSPPLKKSLGFLAAAVGCIPVIFSLAAGVLELRLPYTSIEFDRIVRENHLDETKIITSWVTIYEDEEGRPFRDLRMPWMTHYMPARHPKVRYQLTDIDGLNTVLTAYAGRNYFLNYNMECPDDLYMHYRWKPDASHEMELMKERGLPDFIIGYAPIDEVYGDELLQGVKYVAVKEVWDYRIYKASYYDKVNYLFIREDLLPAYPQFHKLFQ